jgi:hypothetical protein
VAPECSNEPTFNATGERPSPVGSIGFYAADGLPTSPWEASGLSIRTWIGRGNHPVPLISRSASPTRSAFLRFMASPLRGLPASFMHSAICDFETLQKKFWVVGVNQAVISSCSAAARALECCKRSRSPSAFDLTALMLRAAQYASN